MKYNSDTEDQKVMINRRRFQLGVFIRVGLFLVSRASGQAPADADAIAKKVAEAHAHLQEFEVAVTGKVQRVSDSGETKSYSSNYKMAVRRPNRIRHETDGPDPLKSGVIQESSLSSILMIGNEGGVWMFAPALNRYGRLRTNPPEAIAIFGRAEQWVAGFVDRLGVISSATLVGEEKLAREEGFLDCWILDAFDGALQKPVKVWVDKTTYLIVKEQVNSCLKDPSNWWSETTTNEFVFSRVNVHIPDDVFTFTPPAGAKNEDFVLELGWTRRAPLAPDTEKRCPVIGGPF